MSWKKAGLAILALMILVPASQAAVSATADEALAALTPDATTTVGFSASLPCTEMADPGTLTGFGSRSVDVTVAYPDGLSGPETVSLSFDGTPCLTTPTGSASTTGSIDVVAGAAAPGMKALDITLSDGSDEAGKLPVQVGYRMGHNFIVDAQFPLEVGADPVSWNGTLTVTANADTMVMTQITTKAQFGTVGGIFPFKNFRDIPAEGMSETIMFTYTPAGSDWTNDTIEFSLWSHFMEDGTAKTPTETLSWSFTNIDSHDGHEENKGSPGFGLVMGLALIGALVILRRRS